MRRKKFVFHVSLISLVLCRIERREAGRASETLSRNTEDEVDEESDKNLTVF
jgi:hypothetical protein